MFSYCVFVCFALKGYGFYIFDNFYLFFYKTLTGMNLATDFINHRTSVARYGILSLCVKIYLYFVLSCYFYIFMGIKPIISDILCLKNYHY